MSLFINMEALIDLESFLYGDEVEAINEIVDVDFWVDRLITLPHLRPDKLDQAVRLCLSFCENQNFKNKVLKKMNKCPVLIYRLFQRGVLLFEEIEPYLTIEKSYILHVYFRKFIKDFGNIIYKMDKPNDFDEDLLEQDEKVDLLIQFGFLPSSLEYCLKYDDLGVFNDLDNKNEINVKWSPFEWARKPESLDILSFAVYFGSIKCFKHLIMKGYKIDDNARSLSVCCGSFDIFHICNEKPNYFPALLCKASEYYRMSLIAFLLENGVEINTMDRDECTPLHYSAQNNHLGIVNYLVNNGAIVDAKDTNLYTPLHYSAEKGHIKIVEYLVNKGAHIDLMSNNIQNYCFYGLLFIYLQSRAT